MSFCKAYVAGSGSPQEYCTGRTGTVYKATVESWHPDSEKLTCPYCGFKDKPLVRKEREKVANSPFSALCLMSCWPLCFLPMLWKEPPAAINLYCPTCGVFLSSYNKISHVRNPI